MAGERVPFRHAGSLTSGVRTRSGRKFHPFRPRVEEIAIEDIACGLSRRFRYGGQTDVPYTVAQHSVEVSRRVPPADALWGLLHDAAEAWTPDIQASIKDAFCVHGAGGFVPFAVIERRILWKVACAFGMGMHVPATVLDADLRCRATERLWIFAGKEPAWPASVCGNGAKPYADWSRPRDLSTYEIEAEFLARFEELRC